MNKKVLVGLDFDAILCESQPVTQTGSELLDRYRSFLMSNSASYSLVNNFIKEASICKYDSGVNRILESVVDYVNSNKTLWAIASTCESINNNSSSYNYLNRNAARQAENLLEMTEDEAVKYIKAGALKNVMFCEAFRNIAKQVYKDQPIIETAADYTIEHPISLVENVGDGVCFEIKGSLFKMDDDKNIQEAQWNEVSDTFRNITQLMESKYAKIDEHSIVFNIGNSTYEITEANKCKKHSQDHEYDLTLEQLRDNNRLVIMTANPSRKNQLAALLEGVAQVCENYDNIVHMDNVSIYTTRNDRFMVIESENSLYSTLLQSNRQAKWTINENAIDALTFIKKKTNVSLSDRYKTVVENSLEKASEEEETRIQEELKEQTRESYRSRIEALTEKFKNDPVKLAVLSQLAQKVSME